MVIYRSLREIPSLESSVLTIGTFDGVHKGHQEIFREVREYSLHNKIPSVAITFDPHPQHITRLTNQQKKQLLTTVDAKIDKIDKNNIDYLLIIPFDAEFSKMQADDFLKDIIIDNFHPSYIIIGYDHHFGCKRQGDWEFLSNRSAKFHFDLQMIGPVKEDNHVISSTYIRQLILDQKIETANALLGYDLSVEGVVTKGLSRGRTLGYPTANVNPSVADQLIPVNGVYCVSVVVDGMEYPGICNIGYRPTFGSTDNKTIEVHLLADELPDLYEKKIQVQFKNYIRQEIKFETIELLKNQIQNDIKFCEKLVNG